RFSLSLLGQIGRDAALDLGGGVGGALFPREEGRGGVVYYGQGFGVQAVERVRLVKEREAPGGDGLHVRREVVAVLPPAREVFEVLLYLRRGAGAQGAVVVQGLALLRQHGLQEAPALVRVLGGGADAEGQDGLRRHAPAPAGEAAEHEVLAQGVRE